MLLNFALRTSAHIQRHWSDAGDNARHQPFNHRVSIYPFLPRRLTVRSRTSKPKASGFGTWRREPDRTMCNLHSQTRNVEAIRRLFGVSHNRTTSMEPQRAIFPGRNGSVIRMPPRNCLPAKAREASFGRSGNEYDTEMLSPGPMMG